jgi:hypothetical protein
MARIPVLARNEELQKPACVSRVWMTRFDRIERFVSAFRINKLFVFNATP